MPTIKYFLQATHDADDPNSWYQFDSSESDSLEQVKAWAVKLSKKHDENIVMPSRIVKITTEVIEQ